MKRSLELLGPPSGTTVSANHVLDIKTRGCREGSRISLPIRLLLHKRRPRLAEHAPFLSVVLGRTHGGLTTDFRDDSSLT